jgi:hypothetical protein
MTESKKYASREAIWNQSSFSTILKVSLMVEGVGDAYEEAVSF